MLYELHLTKFTLNKSKAIRALKAATGMSNQYCKNCVNDIPTVVYYGTDELRLIQLLPAMQKLGCVVHVTKPLEN